MVRKSRLQKSGGSRLVAERRLERLSGKNSSPGRAEGLSCRKKSSSDFFKNVHQSGGGLSRRCRGGTEKLGKDRRKAQFVGNGKGG